MKKPFNGDLYLVVLVVWLLLLADRKKEKCVYLCSMCRRLVVRATAMFSHAFQFSPWPGASQPS